jgi:predicted amidohydrolase YtcJ
MHSAVVNTAALRLAGVTATTANPPGGVIDRDASGQPTGFLRELAIDLVAQHTPPPTAAEHDAALRAGMAALHRLGITAVHAQRIKDGDDGPREWASLLRLRAAGALHLRVACNVAAHEMVHLAGLGLRTGFGDDYLRLGHVKVFADGSLGSRTAWLLAPFVKLTPEEADNTGVCVTPPAQMAEEFRRAAELGFPISIHAIGDRANRVVLDIFEELASSAPAPAVPHRIEHVQIIDPADLPRLAQLGVTASVQPIHATDDMDTADLFLGERGRIMYNFRSLIASGALVAFGSDAPVADPTRLLGFMPRWCDSAWNGCPRRPGMATSASRWRRRSKRTRWARRAPRAGSRPSAASRRASAAT